MSMAPTGASRLYHGEYISSVAFDVAVPTSITTPANNITSPLKLFYFITDSTGI
jgi:hypothetical protein